MCHREKPREDGAEAGVSEHRQSEWAGLWELLSAGSACQAPASRMGENPFLLLCVAICSRGLRTRKHSPHGEPAQPSGGCSLQATPSRPGRPRFCSLAAGQFFNASYTRISGTDMLGSADLQSEIRVLAMTVPMPQTPLFQTESPLIPCPSFHSDWLLPHS